MHFGRKYIPRSTIEKILLVVFIILIAVVGILVYKMIEKKKAIENIDYDYEVYFATEETNSIVDIDISNMQAEEQKEYVFRVTNYSGKAINKENLKYNIYLITHDHNIDLKLYKNDSKDDLLTNNSNLYIENMELLKDKKQEDYYKLKIIAKEAISNDQKITLQVFNK